MENKKVSKKIVLIIDDKKKDLQDYRKELKKETRLGKCYKVLTAQNGKEALTFLDRETEIHFILLDWYLKGRYTKGTMLREIRKRKPRIYIAILTKSPDPPEVEGAIYDIYFYKYDLDYDRIAQIIKREMEKLAQAPFFSALKDYVDTAQDAWHTPGHSGGDSIKGSSIHYFYNYYGYRLFYSDLSVSVPQLDSLLEPNDIIKESQELSAATFGSKWSFYCTNGTSTSNKIVLQTLLKPLDKILLDRNCHKSVHYAVLSSFIHPIYLQPSKNEKYGILGPVPFKEIKGKIEQYSNKNGNGAKAIILTNCTYDGLIYNLKEIVELAHEHKIKVVVDEAWFAYSYFHPKFRPYSAMAVGADYATQSTHKVLSAFSQASMIHVRDPEFDESKFQDNFMMHISTSPQYLIIASLDIARKQMFLEGKALVEEMIRLSQKLRNNINSLKHFRVLGKDDLTPHEINKDGIQLDETKLTIDIEDSGYSPELIRNRLLRDYHIQIEKSTLNTITVLVTIGTTDGKVGRLYTALKAIENDAGGIKEPKINPIPQKLLDPEFLPQDAFYSEGSWVDINSCKNRVSSIMVVPYPPGIPVVLPGQVIDGEMIEYLKKLLSAGIEIHGIKKCKIKVLEANHGLKPFQKRIEELEKAWYN